LFSEPFVSRQRRAGSCRNAFRILAAQEPGSKRTPYRRAQSDFPIQRQIFFLHALTVEHVVLGLFHLWRSQIIFSSKRVRSHNICSAPFRCAPVEYLPLMNQIVHSTNSFFDRGVRVWAMTEEEVEIFQLQSFEGLAAGLEDVFARQALVVRSVASPEDFARDNYALARPSQF